MQVFINNNARFCYQSKEKSSNTKHQKVIILKQSWKNVNMKKKKIKMENLIDDDLEKRLSDESESESGKDNDESNE